MGELLSQDEIDALMGLSVGGEEETAPSNKNLDKFIGILSESTQNTLSTLLGKNVLLGTAEIIRKTSDELGAENEGPYVTSQIMFEGAVNGPFFLAFKQDDATVIIDLVLMGEGVAKPDFTEEDEDGFTEAINQILGALTTSLKESFSQQIKLSQSGVFALGLADVSCPIQLLEDKNWQAASIPFKIEGVVDTSMLFMMPEGTSKHLEDYHESVEETVDPPPDVPPYTPQDTPQEEKPREPEQRAREMRNIDILLDVELPVSVRVGQSEMTLQDILKLASGSVVELNKSAEAPLELMVNNKRIAKGEVVVLDANFALRLTEIESPEEMLKKLG